MKNYASCVFLIIIATAIEAQNDGVIQAFSCDGFNVKDGSLSKEKTSYEHLDEVVITCNTGYKMFGHAKITCNEDYGSWDFNKPVCVKHQPKCKVPHFENGFMVYKSEVQDTEMYIKQYETILEGEAITFKCHPEYVMHLGSDVMLADEAISIECGEKENWKEPSPPTCHKAHIEVTCENPKVANAITSRWVMSSMTFETISFTDSIMAGNMLEVRCNENSIMYDRANVRIKDGRMTNLKCLDNGVWNKQLPSTCERFFCKTTLGEGLQVVGDLTRKFAHGERQNYSCADGYELLGASTSVCRMDRMNWFPGTPTCRPKQCPNRMNVICDQGFRRVRSAERECLNNGSWSGSPASCERISGSGCNDPGIPDGGSRTGNNYNTNDEVTYECQDGFILVGTAKATCGTDHIWTSPPVKCLGPYEYADPEIAAIRWKQIINEIENENKMSGNHDIYLLADTSDDMHPDDLKAQQLLFGRFAKMFSHTRMSLVTFNNTATVLANNSNSESIGQLLNTTTLIAGGEKSIKKALGIVKKGTGNRKSVILILNGAIKKGGGVSKNMRRRWEYEEKPVVYAITMGPHVDRTDLIETRSISSAGLGNALEYNFFFKGNADVEKLARLLGETRQKKTARLTCGGFTIEYGVVTPRKETYYNTEVIHITCNQGYIITGGSKMTCDKDSEGWNNSPPACVKRRQATCTNNGLENGFMVRPASEQDNKPPEAVSKNAPIFKDDNIVFQCHKEYEMHIGGDTFSEGYKVTILCLETGTWTLPTLPTCHEIDSFNTCENPKLSDAMVSRLDTVEGHINLGFDDFIIEGDIFEVQCRDGYLMNEDSSEIYPNQMMTGIECLPNGTFSTVFPTCTPFTCGKPVSGEGLQVIGGVNRDFHHGDHAAFRCAEGYELLGHGRIVCRMDLGQWFPNPPACRMLRCPALRWPQEGNLVTSRDDIVRLSDENYGTAKAYCNARFNLTGTADRTCLKNGTWSGTPATCTHDSPVNGECADPGIPDGGSRYGTTFRIGYEVEFRCQERFTLFGSSITKCQKNGTWTKPIAKCLGPFEYMDPHNSIGRWNEIIEQIEADNKKNLDHHVFLLADSSGSMHISDLNAERNFLGAISHRLQNTRMSLIVFNSTAVMLANQTDSDGIREAFAQNAFHSEGSTSVRKAFSFVKRGGGQRKSIILILNEYINSGPTLYSLLRRRWIGLQRPAMYAITIGSFVNREDFHNSMIFRPDKTRAPIDHLFFLKTSADLKILADGMRNPIK